MIKWFLLIAFGRLIIHLIQRFPLPSALLSSRTTIKWHSCTLCIGVWIYTILAALFRIDLLSIWFLEIGIVYIPLVTEILTGAMTSWILYIFEIGLREEHFSMTIIE